jgi:hypothetical protein
VLMAYPESIAAQVVHPVDGLPGKCVWPPSIAEVRKACDDILLPQLERERRENERDRMMRMLPPPDAPRVNRPTIEEIKAKLGPDYGIERTGAKAKTPGKTEAELRKEAAEWDWSPSGELLAHIAEREAQKGE